MCSKCDWETYLEDISDMLSNSDYFFAQDTLEGIREWVEENEHITPAQKQAVENIYDSLDGG